MIRWLLPLLLCTPVHAQDRISILLGSHHTEAGEWSESNPGVFLTWEGRFDWTVGAYRNSFQKPSVALSVALPVLSWEGGEASVFGGAAWYPGNGGNFVYSAGDVVPMIGFHVRHGHLFGQVMPGKVDPPEAIFAFGLTFPM